MSFFHERPNSELTPKQQHIARVSPLYGVVIFLIALEIVLSFDPTPREQRFLLLGILLLLLPILATWTVAICLGWPNSDSS